MASTVEKGNELENKFYDYLLEQQNRGDFVYGIHAPSLCKIHKKKSYYCGVREGNIEFDVVIEVYRKRADKPQLLVIFECKNHGGGVKEDHVTAFSHKIDRIAQHGTKGVIIVGSRLQSGAYNVAIKSKMGIAKFDPDGLEVIAERKGGMHVEQGFLQAQIVGKERAPRSLKFSAFDNGNFYSSIDDLLSGIDPTLPRDDVNLSDRGNVTVPFSSEEELGNYAQAILQEIEYKSGAVDLAKICSVMDIDLTFTNVEQRDKNGEFILGAANFDRKSITINSHENKQRERFTIAHEIAHFLLNHGKYLRTETTIASDLFIEIDNENGLNHERLEYQANKTAAYLLMPDHVFLQKTIEFKQMLNMKDRGFGFIYVDDKSWNYEPYNELLSRMSAYFDVSKRAVEIKFMKMKMLNDQRKKQKSLFSIARSQQFNDRRNYPK